MTEYFGYFEDSRVNTLALVRKVSAIALQVQNQYMGLLQAEPYGEGAHMERIVQE